MVPSSIYQDSIWGFRMTIRKFFIAASLATVALFSANANAGVIDFTDGEADITFFYESQTQTWHAVFREKGETEATGLTSPFAGFPGVVGLGTDFTFTSLQTHVKSATSVDVSGTSYIISSAEGSEIFEEGTVDLGIRMRLREDFGSVVDQFASFNLSLNVGGSTYNGNPLGGSGADVSLLNWDAFGNPIALLDTAGGLLTANFVTYGHDHRHWGFSEYGNYDLAFDIQGVGGLHGDSAPPGAFRMSFNVSVPEPSGLSLVAVGLVGVSLRRKRR